MIYAKVYPLADALQMELDVYRRGITDNFELRGVRNFVFPLSKKSDITISAKIEASYVGEYTSAVLIHLANDFWIYMTFDNSVDLNGILTMYYLSFEKVNTKAIIKAVDGQDVETAMQALRPSVKAIFTKETRSIDWVPALQQ